MNSRILVPLVFLTLVQAVSHAAVHVQVQPTGLTYTSVLVNGS
jgi:hypothetical protein